MDLKKKKREDMFTSVFPYQMPPLSLTQINTVPPVSPEEFKYTVINYLLKNSIMLPMDSFTLLRYIKNDYRNVDYISYVFKTFNINEVIRELIQNNLIEYEKICINLKNAYNIKKINIEKLKQYKSVSFPETFKMNNSFDKYNDMAKTIMINYLKEKNAEKNGNSGQFNNFVNNNLNMNLSNSENIYQNPYSSNVNSSIYYYPYNNSNKIFTFESKKRYRDSKKNSTGFGRILKPYESGSFGNFDLDLDKEPSSQNIGGGINNLNSSNQNATNSSNAPNQNKEEENFKNLANMFIYGPTAKSVLSNNDFKGAQNVLSEGNQEYKKILEQLRKKYATLQKPFCEYGTHTECEKHKKSCTNLHFIQIIGPQTDVSLGACSYLDNCRNIEHCKYVHYKIEENDPLPSNRKELELSGDENSLDSQWINCDIRKFDYSVLGKFDVIMADPPWDIHMELPYGTLSDDEMKNLPVKYLQDDGIIFLWVTGRATELARDCLELWGYERKEELVWIKTNQLQRLIRTGRTGHWLNHSKEHCLIGYKGNPKLNRNMDCDVLVSEVRETSRKPDEIYELIERMKPGGRKLELFARPHNRRKGWISLGNQLPGVYFVEQDMIDRFNKAYPDGQLTKEMMEKNKLDSTEAKKIGE